MAQKYHYSASNTPKETAFSSNHGPMEILAWEAQDPYRSGTFYGTIDAYQR